LPTGPCSKKDSVGRSWLKYQVDQIDSAWVGLAQNEIDESTLYCAPQITSGARTLLFQARLKDKPGNRYSRCLVSFGFELFNSKMEMDFFDFAPRTNP